MTKPVLALLLSGACLRGIHSFSLTVLGGRRRTSTIATHVASRSRPATVPVALLKRPFASEKSRRRHDAGERRGGASLPMASTTSAGDAAPSDGAVACPPAGDGAALRSLFAERCAGGRMTEDDLRNVPAIKDMLEQGDLLSSELAAMWAAAPKSPLAVDSSEGGATPAEVIDVDGFIQVYQDIDDLFEEDDDDQTVAAMAAEDAVAKGEESPDDGMGEAEAVVADEEDTGLKEVFVALGGANREDPSISFLQLRQWDDVADMIGEEELSEDELLSYWEMFSKGDRMDFKGFVKFNEELFEEFEDEDEADVTDVEKEEVAVPPPAPRPVITEIDLPPAVLFSQLANENYLVSKEDMQRWGELNGMLKEGDLTMDEFNALFDGAPKARGSADMLDEDGFCILYDSIDELFEDEDPAEEKQPPPEDKRELKEELLEYIEDIAKISDEEGRQICGLDCSEMEQERVLEIVRELEREPYNQVVALSLSGDGVVPKEELVGTWDLVYSSSSTMKYNNGLSGLAGGLTRFGGLQQKLSATKYLSDVEYTEQAVGKFGGQEAEFKITGDWDLKMEVSLFTGKPSNVLSVLPDKVTYGPRSDKADHWKSLGPMNMLVLSYLDEDLRVMRGNTSVDTLFILKRIA